MAKTSPQIYRKMSTGDGVSISLLAHTIPQDRGSRYAEIKNRLGSIARTVALRILKQRSDVHSRKGNASRQKRTAK